MEFRYYLKAQIKKHPSLMPCDVAKACYQAAMGAEHLLLDASAAKQYFDAEFSSVAPREGEIWEFLSDDICRIDLGAWKSTGMPSEWLFNMFVSTATVSHGGRDLLENYLAVADEIIKDGEARFSLGEWRNFLEKYKSSGLPAIHHSGEYRAAENPAYRIVDRAFLTCLPILVAASRINGKEEDESVVIAIDGRAASGKTTVADMLARILKTDVVRADDFFLPPSLRTGERLSEAGGNLHYERFCDEILPYVGKKTPFSYGTFDCGEMEITGRREIGENKWRIVEGSYCHHPKFADYADLRVFCTVDAKEQIDRILIRNGERWAERFKNEWIPMEERYFSAFNIRGKADVVILSNSVV